MNERAKIPPAEKAGSRTGHASWKEKMCRPAFLCLLLALATLAVYLPVGRQGFVNYDDSDYVTENAHVLSGLTRANVVWAFTTGHASNWHPVTWLSHMLDCQLFGTRAGAQHLVSVGFHIANALLLLLLLRRMTGALWRSALVAALFALHPLHVESVAWASERKDVLSGFFFLLTVGAYVGYVEGRRAGGKEPGREMEEGKAEIRRPKSDVGRRACGAPNRQSGCSITFPSSSGPYLLCRSAAFFRPWADEQADAGDVALCAAAVGLLAIASF